jgi:hypothetical protein
VIKAEQSKIKLALEEIAAHKKRIKQLEGQLKRARKFALVAGVAAVVAILVGVRK